MVHDAKSSYDITSVKAYASLAAAASSQTSTVSRKPYTSGSTFAIDVASVGTGGVLTVTLQNYILKYHIGYENIQNFI